MTDRPGIVELARGAKEFVRENQAFVIDYAMPLIFFILIAEAMQQIGPVFAKGYEFAGMIISSYFTACFVLAWHRASLLGPKREHVVHPFGLKPGEGRFIITFFLLAIVAILFFVVGVLPGILIGFATRSIGLSVLISLVAGIAALLCAVRFMFMLPARSVNASISWGEAWQVSRGLVWRLIAGSFIANILLILLILLIASVALGIVFGFHLYEMAGEEFIVTLPGGIVMFFVLGIPSVMLNFIALARGVTILSRLYQWSIQNRTLPAKEAA